MVDSIKKISAEISPSREGSVEPTEASAAPQKMEAGTQAERKEKPLPNAEALMQFSHPPRAFLSSQYIIDRDKDIVFYARDKDVLESIAPALTAQGYEVNIKKIRDPRKEGLPPAPKENEKTEGWHDWEKSQAAVNATVSTDKLEVNNAQVSTSAESGANAKDAGRPPIQRASVSRTPDQHLNYTRKSFFVIAKNRHKLAQAAAKLEDALLQDREPYHKH